MSKYCYLPILKTRPSEVNAYDTLDSSIKDDILPIIEMTGELGYTYSKKCKDEKLKGTRRPGDINKKISKILGFMDGRRFILDITDDASLKYDGLSSTGSGLLNPEAGYKNWIDFLNRDSEFKQLVIPTIQFDTTHMQEVEKQIKILNESFDYLAVKLPVVMSNDGGDKNIISQVISYITSMVGENKLFVILDFDYLTKLYDIKNMLQGISTSKIKAIIPVCSCFPSTVPSCADRKIPIIENEVSERVKEILGDKVFHGDFSSIHPKRYEMGGGGWYPRIDFVERDLNTRRPLYFRFVRSSKRNTSSEYYYLAQNVIASSNYNPIQEVISEGDKRIKQKAEGGSEGKAPAYWIAVRANIYMTMQCLYLRKQADAFLSL